nr:hypothetical protein [Pirellula sp.]
MSNRRGNSGDRPTPRKPKVPLPVVARSEGRLRREQVDEQSDPSSRPVRGRTSTIARPVSRRQQGDAASLRRFLILSTLGLALAISLSAFIVYVFNRPPNVPLIARLSTSKSNILGEHPAAVLFRQSKNEASSRAESPPNRERSFRFMDFENESSIGTAGGRNRNVVLFYFNGIVTTDPNESDSVQLWFDDNSFSTASRDRTSVDLKSLLLDISTSKKLSSSAHALVILDVAPPAVTTNLGDLVFPAKAIQGIFEKMPDENKKRLSVLLPSSQGEESWIAPELGSSVFGHFASQGIETGFGDPALTIKTYADKVAEQVAGWVKLKRSATQSPWLLTSKEDFSNFKLFTSFFKTPEFTPPIRVEYGTRTEKLAGLWSDFDQLKGYRWLDPVLYGSIESQLLILEDIAETPGNLAQRVEQIKESFVDLKSRWKPTLRPSLIESRFYQELGLDTRTRFSSESIQGTLEGNLDVSRKSRDDQAILLWNTWYKVASEGGAQNWRKEFQPSTMKARLDSLGAAEKVEWLEIQFGRILCDASPFNPSNEDDSHIRATAKLIKAFGDLQTIATTTKAFGTSDPKPTRVPWERTRLMQEDFNNIEARFLELVDHFIVQDYKKALSEHSPLLEHIVSLQAKANQIDEAIEFRDRVLYEAPHLLAFLLREYRYIAVDQPSNEEAKKTGIAKFEQIKSMLKPARDIEKKLREERVVELPQVTVEEWDKLIAAELSDKTLLRGENLDSRTIRVYRASLRTPFIKTTDRKDRYRSMSDFYAKGPLLATASNEEDKPVNQTVQVLEMPLELKDESFRFSKEQIDLSTDSSMRSRIFRLSRLYEKPASSESGDNNRGVLRVELENQEKAFLAWQQYRHYVKRFGAGELPTDPEDYYFRQIAKAYSTPLFVNDKSSSAIQDDDDAWNPAKDAFKKLRDSGGERSEDRTTITIQDSSHWKARS